MRPPCRKTGPDPLHPVRGIPREGSHPCHQPREANPAAFGVPAVWGWCARGGSSAGALAAGERGRPSSRGRSVEEGCGLRGPAQSYQQHVAETTR